MVADEKPQLPRPLQWSRHEAPSWHVMSVHVVAPPQSITTSAPDSAKTVHVPASRQFTSAIASRTAPTHVLRPILPSTISTCDVVKRATLFAVVVGLLATLG